MSERRFGVEIECGLNGAGWGGSETVRRSLRDAKIPVLSVGHDGSGVEVRTRVLKGDKGFEELKSVFDHLIKIGCYVETPPDGQHIHLEALEYKGVAGRDNRKRFIESYVNNRDNILPMIYKDRWTDDTNCAAIWEDVVAANKHDTTYGAKGWDINLYNLSRSSNKTTIEVRLHEGNLDFEKAKAWISFWQDFLDKIPLRKTPFPKYKGTLLDRVVTREDTKAKLKAAVEGYAHA